MRRPTSLTSASLIPDFRTMIMFPPPMLATVYFLKLFICGGPDMAPALPQLADTRFGSGHSVSAADTRFGPWKQKRRGLVGPRRLSCVWRHGLFVRPWLPCAQLMGASRRTVGK